ncbi:tetraspanin-16-like [Hemitrygon akajei]|uniref:tetraspanin-16-like n=1 Tax=Hemitrygon akajei TaxID=2704970 RepID=UPI003BF943F2
MVLYVSTLAPRSPLQTCGPDIVLGVGLEPRGGAGSGSVGGAGFGGRGPVWLGGRGRRSRSPRLKRCGGSVPVTATRVQHQRVNPSFGQTYSTISIQFFLLWITLFLYPFATSVVVSDVNNAGLLIQLLNLFTCKKEIYILNIFLQFVTMEDKTLKTENAESHAINSFICIKIFMIVVNTIISVAGLVLLGFGVWMKVHGDAILQILGSRAGHMLNVSYFCIVGGCFLTLFGFFGCCGTIKESKVLLMMYFIAVSMIFIGEIICAIVILIFKSIIVLLFQDEALKLLKNNYTGFGDKNLASTGWDALMKTLHCCGLNNYTDFEGSNYQIQKGRLYPKSCCRNPFSAECDGLSTSANVIYTKGCLSFVTSMIKRNSSIIGGVTIGISLIQMMAMAISLTFFIKLFRNV